MSVWFAILLGLVQGVAEFLPISSSGHLAIMQIFFADTSVPLLFDVLLHFGTLCSIFIVFRRDIGAMLREIGGFFSDAFTAKRKGNVKAAPARRLVLLILVATLPLVITLFFKGEVERLMQSPVAVGLALCATGLLLFATDRWMRGSKTERDATMGDALVVGTCQAVAALFPGLSRSGTTIAGGLFRKFDRAFAVRFSFLLSIPAVLGATLLEVADVAKEGIDAALLFPSIAGTLAAFLVGLWAISLVKRLVDKGRFGFFAYYCLAVGLISIIASFLV